MIRVTVWPQLLLLVLILRHSAAVPDQCSQLREVISRLERDIVSITKLKHKNELRDGNCHEKLQTTNDGLTKRVDTMNQQMFEKQTQLQTNIDGLIKRVELLNEMSQFLCEVPKDVCRSLLKAAKSGDVNSARRLLKCDSNDKCTDNDKYRNTPLLYAARYGSVEFVRVLLEGGANVDRANKNGDTALHVAAESGHLDVCRLLLDWGAKVDRLNMFKNTPLIWAAMSGRLSVAKLLVERGADVSVKGDGGKTASDVALDRGNKDVADWLEAVRRG